MEEVRSGSSDSVPVTVPDLTHTIDIKIENFATANKSVQIRVSKHLQHFSIHFFIDVFPNAIDARTTGWVTAFLAIDIESRNKIYCFTPWTLSVIDKEGKSRVPRSWINSNMQNELNGGKYLKRCFILDRGDEFLPKGVLTLRCEIYSPRNEERSFPILCRYEEKKLLKPFNKFLCSIPHEVSYICPRGSFVVYDFTSQILTLPKYHELRIRYGRGSIDGIPPASPLLGEVPKDILEHTWMFDTDQDRFLLSLDERLDSVGARLLEASSFIRRCVNAPLKEHAEKRIRLPGISSRTFKIVLFFLEKGTIPCFRYRDFLPVYKFSHLYEMKDLQQECTKYWVRCPGIELLCEEVKEIAGVYSDEYLSAQLLSSLEELQEKHMTENHSEIIKTDRLNFDCYT